jgi:hypothetical protein
MGKGAILLGSAAVVTLVVGACGGSNAPSGFGIGADGGGLDAKVDGTGGGGGKDSGIHLLGDSSGGGDAAPPCTGIACQVKSCGGGGDTTVSGYVYAPNGKLPLYDVQVFIPNAPLADLPKGVQCDQCGAPVSGSPITTGLSDPTGHFTLTGVPSGANIPIVVQLGKWRRQATIPMVNSCTANTLTDPNLTRLPATQSEGSMPHIALTTGGCDNMGCMLPKVGIDPSEFGYQSDGYNKAVNTYQGTVEGWPTATAAQNLWGSPSLLSTYDVAIFSCECSEALESKGGSSSSPDFANISNYLNAGGRIFTTDFQYTWYKYNPDPAMGGTPVGNNTIGLGEIWGGAPYVEGEPIDLVTTFPKGAALAAWLKFVYSGVPLPSGVTFPVNADVQAGSVLPDEEWGNVQYLNMPQTLTWGTAAYQNDPGWTDPPPPTGTIEPRVFTVDTPVGKPTAMQCGRGVHLDAHIDVDGEDSVDCPTPPTSCYPSTCSTTLNPDEAMFAFFFFDLSSCIQDESKPPVPPPPAPK